MPRRLLALTLLDHGGTGRTTSRFLKGTAMAQRKYRPLNDNEAPGLEVEVAPLKHDPNRWLVEAIDYGSDGEMYRAIFSGPDAKQRAFDYARLTYGKPSGPTHNSRST